MMSNNDSLGTFSICVAISFTGFMIIAAVVLSLIPIYIKNQSVEIPTRPLAVYTLYNLTFYVNITSVSDSRAVQSSINVSSLTLATLQAIEAQLNKNFATIEASGIITAASYNFNVSQLIVTLKILFAAPCTNSLTCVTQQKTLITNILNELQPITINGKCYYNCSTGPVSCSLVATVSTSSSTFTIATGSTANQVPVGDPCATTTTTSTSRTTSTVRGGRRIRRDEVELLLDWYSSD